MPEQNAEHDAAAEWFPDDQHGYSIAICRCEEGSYLGARKMGTPCCCERCGFITQEQFDYLRESLASPRAIDVLAGLFALAIEDSWRLPSGLHVVGLDRLAQIVASVTPKRSSMPGVSP